MDSHLVLVGYPYVGIRESLIVELQFSRHAINK